MKIHLPFLFLKKYLCMKSELSLKVNTKHLKVLTDPYLVNVTVINSYDVQ